MTAPVRLAVYGLTAAAAIALGLALGLALLG